MGVLWLPWGIELNEHIWILFDELINCIASEGHHKAVGGLLFAVRSAKHTDESHHQAKQTSTEGHVLSLCHPAQHVVIE